MQEPTSVEMKLFPRSAQDILIQRQMSQGRATCHIPQSEAFRRHTSEGVFLMMYLIRPRSESQRGSNTLSTHAKARIEFTIVLLRRCVTKRRMILKSLASSIERSQTVTCSFIADKSEAGDTLIDE